MSLLEQVVPEGYKQTDIGIVPSEWSEKSFGDICVVNQGLQIPIEQRAKRQTDGSKVYITIQSLNSLDEPEFIETYSPSVCCNESDILMTRTGNTGIVVHGVTGVFHNNFFKLKFDRNKINDLFLVYYLRSNRCQKTILDKAGTSTIPDLNHGDFYSIKLALPEYNEQTAIANALSDVDALLTELEKLIDKKQAIKTATMQQLLTGKTRLPQFTTYTEGAAEGKSKGTKPSELGEIPEDWDVKKLGELGKFKNGINKDADSFGHGSPFINLMDVFGQPQIKGSENFGLIHSTPLEQKEYGVLEGDVLFIRSSVKPSGVGLTSVAKLTLKQVVYSGFLIRFRSNKTLDNEFKVHCFYEENFRKRIVAASTVSANTNINQDALKDIQIAFPSKIEEQAAIATILSDMDNEIQTLEQRLKKTRQIKQSMMQQLLTGRTRLPFKKLETEQDGGS